MTELGVYLAKRSINKSEVSRKTGISKPRLSELTLKESAHLRAKELYLISLAIGADPCDVLKEIYSGISLENGN
ncbi:MAG: helix-turn-helix transcriptional regulator [Bacteroidota bacterium]